MDLDVYQYTLDLTDDTQRVIAAATCQPDSHWLVFDDEVSTVLTIRSDAVKAIERGPVVRTANVQGMP